MSQSTMSQSAYEYPRLPRPEIISALNKAKIASITEAELENPTLEFVAEINTKLLIHLDEEEKGQVESEALQQLENPHHHVTSVQYMNLYCKVKKLLVLLDCPLQMNYKDLIRPEPSRTEFIISSLLNYALYRDSKMKLINQKAQELTLLNEQRKQWEAKIFKVMRDKLSIT
ncbi:PREDICTED: kinetochore protein NUF2-like [Camelina sativa]|uniref:Kinetochore protein NUF2-like n=1 Tax=Camelina sativa TaxID=90675 RepID=A0ABM0YTN4_CAMSA|nr:PREDICTED: kinetochore protein NUF2-like [Camelina sativa]